MSNFSFEKGMWLALAFAKCACLCKSMGRSARATRKAEWSGSNPTVMLVAEAYFQVNLPSPQPISRTCAFVKSTNLWSFFFSNPSGSFCTVIKPVEIWLLSLSKYGYFFFVAFTERWINSFKTLAFTSFNDLIYKQPLPVVCLPSFPSKSA